MKKVLTIGSAIQDIFISYKNPQAAKLEDSLFDNCSFLLIAEGCKIEVDELYYATGGGGTNSAVSFKRLDCEVTSFFKCGDDSEASYIEKKLSQEGINLTLVCKTNTYKTGRSFILPSPIGNRPILAYRGANGYITKEDLPLDKLNQFDLLYITSLSGQSSDCLIPLTKTAHHLDITVAVNPGTSQLAQGAEKLKQALPYISILLLNATEASQLMYELIMSSDHQKKSSVSYLKQISLDDAPHLLKQPLIYKNITFSLSSFFTMIHDYGPQLVVVTNGAEGVYASDQKFIYFHESISAKIVSTVGCGDAFGSCFVKNILHGESIEKALLKGILNASSVISYLDAKEGLLTQKKLEHLANATSYSTIKKYEL